MILGMDLMQGHRLVYDHEAKRFWFAPSLCKRNRRNSTARESPAPKPA
jgi:hypothetical protein